MSAVNFLVELLVRAGVARQVALQLAQAYLARHGVAFDPARAVEQILEDLARGGGGAVVGQGIGGVTLTESGGGAGFPGLAPAGPANSQQLEQLFAQLADASRGAVSEQALSSYQPTFAQAIGLVAYQTAASSGDLASLDADTYDQLSQGGLLDAPDLV